MRVHQHGACIADNSEQLMGRSRGGLTTKSHAVVDTYGLPIRLALTTGEAYHNRLVLTLLSGLKSGAILLADRGFDADWTRTFVSEHVDGRTFRRDGSGGSQSASAPISIAPAIWSIGSSTRLAGSGYLHPVG